MFKQMVFLGLLAQATFADLEMRIIVRSWPANRTVFRESDACHGLHIVRDGMIKLYRSAPDGHEQILLVQPAGSLLAIAPLLDGLAYPYSARTLQPSKTYFLPRAQFEELYRKHPDFARAITNELVQRSRTMVTLVDSISLKSVVARVATRLLEVALASDALDGEHAFRLTLTQEQLASALATSRESVARAMAELRRDGAIEQHGPRIRVLNRERLAARAAAVGEPIGSPALFAG